ncbi:hypothetical protein [Maricaulis sp.]|uniref:hypothetical protein n=1 Tax=Maricaulis sp. TaxID=1486257 RepID=UPI003A8DAEDB
MSGVVFTVADLSVWQVFQWRWFAVLYVFAAAFIAFPRLLKIWPLSNFRFFKKRGRLNGFLLLGMTSIIGGGHLFLTLLPLEEAWSALRDNRCATVVAAFDGRKPDRELMMQSFAEMTLTFEGVDYDVPGGLHGAAFLLPRIRADLETGGTYRMCVLDNLILVVERSSADKSASLAP